uniref:AB hydrolase-1 domain-containing protein n=2 Tax=Chenopodium quinoa TaxID=63459 RepID=A0A803N260_CHEQI
MGNISGGGHGRRTAKSMDESECEITSPRIRLNDGRFLAYREIGVPKEQADFKIIIVHGFGSNKDMSFSAPQGLIEELKIYMLLYDRAGYADSDPNPERSLKSEALDIEQLADQLELGPKFYVIGVSMGSYPIWSCLKLQGVALVAAVVNYSWPSLPKSLIKDDFRRNLVKLTLFVLKHMPSLLYWWMNQKCLPTANVMEKNPVFFSERDQEVLKRTPGFELLSENKIEQRSIFDNLRGDILVGLSKWEFDPLKLNNPFPKDESVHLWVGYEDKVVPVELQRHVMEELPWIKYHEIPHGGHLIVYDTEVCESILRALLLNEEPAKYIPLPGTPKLIAAS